MPRSDGGGASVIDAIIPGYPDFVKFDGSIQFSLMSLKRCKKNIVTKYKFNSIYVTTQKANPLTSINIVWCWRRHSSTDKEGRRIRILIHF